MSQITNLPTEILLDIKEHLGHPVLFSGDALACTCVSMWERLGGTSVFLRAAGADRIRTLRADEICLDICQVEVNEELDRSAIKDYELIEAYRGASYTKEDVAWLQGMARKGMGPTNTDTIADACFPREVHMSYTLEDVTSKTFLNRAIMGPAAQPAPTHPSLVSMQVYGPRQARADHRNVRRGIPRDLYWRMLQAAPWVGPHPHSVGPRRLNVLSQGQEKDEDICLILLDHEANEAPSKATNEGQVNLADSRDSDESNGSITQR
ncbi:nitrogen metabolic regulation nmr [Apiospora arundinis]